jgi:quercetin dioxygenase-like cupin family protein
MSATRPNHAATASEFADRGFLSPILIFSASECARIKGQLHSPMRPAPATWEKGRAASDYLFFSLGSRPALVAQLVPLLGEDIILWGACVVQRSPGQVHPWHTDIESSDSAGGFVSAWIGIENTSRESGLQLIPGSHLYGMPIQRAAAEHGVSRGDRTADAALRVAHSFDPHALLEQPSVRDGEALIFDGRLWHGSHNLRDEGTRTALLLQYAAAKTPVRVPDFGQLEWPFRILDRARPPVIVVHGRGAADVNDVVQPPALPASTPAPITTVACQLDLPLAWKVDRVRTHHHLFEGPTAVLRNMESHASVLKPGCSPHPPHIHPEEEILLMLEGEADVVFADDAEGTNRRVTRVSPGSLAYYPSGQYHTIENTSASPISYVMFKWRAAPEAKDANSLETDFFHFGHLNRPKSERRSREILFSSPTHQLSKLQAHLTHMPSGGGYAPHVDAHDVLIHVLSGQIEVSGHALGPHGVFYCAAGYPHGLKNIGKSWSHYLVLEFHASGAEIGHATSTTGHANPSRVSRLARSFRKRVNRLKAWLGWPRGADRG